MNNESSNLSYILKQLRTERGASLRDFSGLLGISHAYLNKLEKGEDIRTGKPITPTIDTLVKIAEGLNIPINKFMDMCGYFDNDYKANEPLQREHIKIDVDISDMIAQLSSGIAVSFNDTQINEAAKAALCQELRESFTKLHEIYGTKTLPAKSKK